MPHIIVLEDDEVLGERISRELVSMGHEVRLTKSLLACLTALNEEKFDLVITEFFVRSERGVTHTSGATVTIAIRFSEIKKDGLNVDPKLPIIVLDGQAADEEPLEFCEMLGACATLRLPFVSEEFRKTVDAVLRPKRPARALRRSIA